MLLKNADYDRPGAATAAHKRFELRLPYYEAKPFKAKKNTDDPGHILLRSRPVQTFTKSAPKCSNQLLRMTRGLCLEKSENTSLTSNNNTMA
jgi:hypothetical protein